MLPGETHGDTLALPRLAAYANTELLPGIPQRHIFRVKAPFHLTKMRGWTGSGCKQVWLWSRHGKEWVIDQDLYLGRDRQGRPLRSYVSSPLHDIAA
jgi:hypothetical protein